MFSLARGRARSLKVVTLAALSLVQALGQAAFWGCSVALATGADWPWRTLLVCALLGAIVKVLAQSGAAAIQASWVSAIGIEVRAAVLAGTLVHTPRHHDHGERTKGRAEECPPGEIAARIEDVERGLGEGLFPAARALIELVPLVLLLAWQTPRFAVLALLAVLPLWWLISRSRRSLSRLVRTQLVARAALARWFDDAIRHRELLQVHGASAELHRAVAREGHAHAKHAQRLALHSELASGQNEVLGVLFVWLCLLLAPDESTATGALMRFLALFFLLYRPLRQLAIARPLLARGRAALAVLPLEPRPQAAENGDANEDAKPWPSAALHVHQLRAAHGDGLPLSCHAEPGSLWLLTGKSGRGKTSLFRTLLGLEAAGGGALRYGETELLSRGVGPAERPFAWVPQHCPVLGADVHDALLLGARAARDQAQLLEGVEGTALTLSGGEAQRVALVRAFSTEAPILLLDEPTAHLDASRALAVVEAIRAEQARGRIVMIATHQPELFEGLPQAHKLCLDRPSLEEAA